MSSTAVVRGTTTVRDVKKWAARDAEQAQRQLEDALLLESDFVYVFVDRDELPDPELGGQAFFEIGDEEPLR